MESINAPEALPACSHLLSVALVSQSSCLSLTGSLIGSVEPFGCLAGPLESSGSGQLQKDQRWDASHYGNLEQFIYDYLVGGASAGESVRLKLQTPLFVADAILQAAQRQLVEELQTATQARPHVSAVHSLLLMFVCSLRQAETTFAVVIIGVIFVVIIITVITSTMSVIVWGSSRYSLSSSQRSMRSVHCIRLHPVKSCIHGRANTTHVDTCTIFAGS